MRCYVLIRDLGLTIFLSVVCMLQVLVNRIEKDENDKNTVKMQMGHLLG